MNNMNQTRSPRGLSQLRASSSDHRSSLSSVASGTSGFRSSRKLSRSRLHSQGEEGSEAGSASVSMENSFKIIFAHLHEDAEVAQETQILPALPCSLQSL